jgi:hypothetical protein
MPNEEGHGASEYPGEERRVPRFTDAEINLIADRAAERALEKVYGEIGKAVLKKFLWVIGAAALAAYVWFTKGGAK